MDRNSRLGEAGEAAILYAVRQTGIEKLPYAEDIDEYMPKCYTKVYTESTEDDFDKDKDLVFIELDELVRLFYDKQKKVCPIKIQSFDDLLEQTVTGVDGESYRIESHESYLECYGLEFDNIYWIRSVPVFVCISICQEDAERFIEEHCAQLSDPKIVPIEAGKAIPVDQTAQFPF